jgi:hypothetical protein
VRRRAGRKHFEMKRVKRGPYEGHTRAIRGPYLVDCTGRAGREYLEMPPSFLPGEVTVQVRRPVKGRDTEREEGRDTSVQEGRDTECAGGPGH